MMAVEAVEAQPRLAPLGAAVTFVLAAGMAPVLVRFIRLSGLTVAVDGLWLGAGLWLVLLHGRGDRLSWESLRRSAPGGAAFGLSIVFFVSSVKLTTVTDATIINALQPALVFVVASSASASPCHIWPGPRSPSREWQWSWPAEVRGQAGT